MTAINTTTLASIADISLEDFITAYHNDDPIAAAYYSELASQGASVGNTNIQNYAALAEGVVNNDTVAGQLANAYSESVAAGQSVDLSVGSDAWLTVQYHLMQNDLARRQTLIAASGTGELDYQDTNNIHTAAFDQVDLPSETFTLYPATQGLGQNDPAVAQALFEDMLANGNSTGNLVLDFLGTDTLNGWAHTTGPEYWQWLGHLTEGLWNHPEALGTGFETFVDNIKETGRDVLWPVLVGEWLGEHAGQILSDWVTDAKTPWNAAFSESSPLVLDLTAGHDGIALTSFNAATTTTFFDIDNSGFATQTAWVGENMGLLCRDLNDNGKIDNAGELFGSATVDGFALLSTLDSNGDHRIDQYDSAWSTLKIWVDANGDAVTQDGELHTLGDLNVKSIDLAAVASSTSTINGNPISHTSFFTFDNGSTATVADAWFVHDKVNSYYNGDYTLDVDTLFLPTLRGFGTLPDLAISMSIDSTLKGLVDDFTSGFDPASSFSDAATLNGDITDILYQWAGVEGVDPGDRGGRIDARQLEFMEKFFAQEYLQNGLYPDPYANAGTALSVTWEHVFLPLKVELLTQAGADAVYGGTISYNPYTGEFTGDMTLSSDAIDALQAAAPTDTTAHTAAYWEQVAEYIAFTKGFTNLTGGEVTMLDDAIYATDSTLSWTYIETHTVPDWVGISVGGGPDDDTIYGTSGNDSLDGGAGNDTLYGYGGNDVLHGGTGDDVIYTNSGDSSTLYGDDGNDTLNAGWGGDTLYGGNGNDLLNGGSGDDVLDGGAGGNFVTGGNGNDTYVFSSGNDVYSEYGTTGTDTIQLPSGIDFGDLVFSGIESGAGDMNLLVTVGTLGSFEISEFASTGTILSGIETITFYDTTTFDPTSLTALTVYGTGGDDYMYGLSSPNIVDTTFHGGAGNDTIHGDGGNDTFDGGAGNDLIYALTGDDTYIASPGFDTIGYDTGGSDVIVMPEGITAENVHFLRHADSPYDLEITVDGLGQIHIASQFYNSSYAIETIQFSDSSTIDLTTHQIETVGTYGNDTITGIASGGSIDNIIDGREGNDDLFGGTGNDTFYFSPGTDTLSDTGGTDTLAFHVGVNFEDLAFSTSVYNDNLVLTQSGTGDSMTMYFQLDANADHHVETLSFNDGFTVNVADYAGWQSVSGTYTAGNGGETDIGSSGADTITGGTGDDAIVGMAGNDTLYGGDGADQLRGGDGTDTLYGDAGNDWLWGGNGADTLSGGNGNDVLAGGDGADSMTGGSGADTFVFDHLTAFNASDTISDFSTGDDDTLDIHDLLTGYDPTTSAITDFVHVTASGGNAILSVDADGAAGGAPNFVAIATLTGQSALAGTEADLLTNGHLLALAA